MDDEKLKVSEYSQGKPTTFITKITILDDGNNEFGIAKFAVWDLHGFCSLYTIPKDSFTKFINNEAIKKLSNDTRTS